MRMQDICGYRITKLTFVKHNRPNTVIRGQSKEEMLFDIYIYIYIYRFGSKFNKNFNQKCGTYLLLADEFQRSCDT